MAVKKDYRGALRVGNDADVVIFSAHPLGAQGHVEVVFVDGKIVYRR